MTSPKWIQTLEKLAPTVASAFGTPLAGMAVSAIESALGLTGGNGSSEGIEAAITAGTLTGDQITALKKADQDFAARMKQMDIDLAKMQFEDVASARSREVAVKDDTPRNLAYMMIGGFFTLSAGMCIAFIGWPEKVAAVPAAAFGMIGTVIGYLLNESKSAANYYFGTTQGNENSTSNDVVAGLTSTTK